MSMRFTQSTTCSTNHLTEVLDDRGQGLYSQSTLQLAPTPERRCKGRATEMATHGSEALAGPQSQKPPTCRHHTCRRLLVAAHTSPRSRSRGLFFARSAAHIGGPRLTVRPLVTATRLWWFTVCFTEAAVPRRRVRIVECESKLWTPFRPSSSTPSPGFSPSCLPLHRLLATSFRRSSTLRRRRSSSPATGTRCSGR